MMAKMQQTLQFQVNDGEQANGKAGEGIKGLRWSRLVVVMAFAVMLGVALLLPILHVSSAHAQLGVPEASVHTDNPSLRVSVAEVPHTASEIGPIAPLLAPSTTLTVAILSSPWATLDNTDILSGPRVFVVQAVVTNTGATTATLPTVVLDYDPGLGWALSPGEIPTRSTSLLAPNEAFHAYWFATYPAAYDSTHQYTVTASANNVPAPVSTSDNYFGNPETGKTVKTRSTLSTGSSGVTQVNANVTVGVAFTVTVDYEFSKNVEDAAFSPVGNLDFSPAAYRLVASEVRFFDSSATQLSVFTDQLYIETIPGSAESARATYTFIAISPASTRLCSYATFRWQNPKYDQFYCDEDRGTIINITGTVRLLMTKQANTTVQQGQSLTYTIQYTSGGTLPMTWAWIWDYVDRAIGSLITTSVVPTTLPPGATDPDHVAWYLDTIPESGQPGSTGTHTFTIRIDGGGQDLADDTLLVNHAFFGVNPFGNSPPGEVALTRTVTTTILAPTIEVAKTDGQVTAEPGDALTYTLRITNSGSITATDLIITDVLPADVNYAPGAAIPPEITQTGQTLVWDNQDPISPNGGAITITVPVTVDIKAQNGITLANSVTVDYKNPAGYRFDTKTATDTTTVNAPVLSISKSDYPEPVLTGQTITYTIHYTNSGPSAATNVLITDVVPLSTTYEDGSCTGGITCTLIGSDVVSWTIGTVQAYTDSTVSFSVLVTDALTLQTGDLIYNDDYGITADQTGFIAGPSETTEVSREAAFFDGYAFWDANGNGSRDGGEVGLPGIAITLTSATVPVTTTDGSGYYHFRVETEDPITITSGLPAGYFRTTPGAIVFADSVFGITTTVDFGYAPITSSFGVIYGTVFEDTNHDGNQDLGEDGLPTVTLESTLAATSPVTTNHLGQYTFRYDISGTLATITETNPTFYVSTTPDVVQRNVVTGSSNGSPIDFGDFLGIKITGTVFYDADVDGVKDPAEGGVAGATVDAGSDSSLTGGSGVYTLYVTVSDSNPITITETDPGGYISTNAVPGTNVSLVDADRLRIDSPISGQVYTGDFGDVLAGDVITISGQVWEDNGVCAGCLANGQLDSGEFGLAGAVISLSSGLSQTTASDGFFLLYAPPDEAITVTETNPYGYISTNAIPGNNANKVDNDTLVVSPLVSGTTSANNLFGDVLSTSVALITGTVFNDANENGVFDGGESGLPGVVVTLEISGGNTITVPTDSAGGYQFPVAPGTDVRITSDGPDDSNYYPTTPESVFARPPAAGVYPDYNFGYSNDSNVAVIYGLVFDDVNGNGQPDFGELGLAGAVITLTNGTTTSVTTGGPGIITGTFTFSVPRPVAAVIYSLHEQNPPGYRSTTPDDINVSVRPAIPNYYVEFGDTDSSDIANLYGTAFDDFNGNGLQDKNEPGLAGVVITVTTSGASPLTTTTKTYGQYSYGFELALDGRYTVKEDDPALPGYHSTTPDEVNIHVFIGNSYIVNFGDTNDPQSAIMGIVFDDWSGDGIQQLAEDGIPGVEISLSNGITTTTQVWGTYTFPITTAGYITVTETDPVGYHSTTPNSVLVHVTDPLSEAYLVNFGDSKDSLGVTSFFGTVFDDQNASGGRNVTEPPLEGVTVNITGTADVDFDTYVTNNWGQYTFVIDITGTYTVTEVDPVGYLSTNAIPGDPAVTKIDNNTFRTAVNTLGTDLGDNLFGDVLASQVITISGYVWDDNGAGGGIAGDGQPNGSEPRLAGALVRLSSGLTQTTTSTGDFMLYAPHSTVITITESNPTNYDSTNAIPGHAAVTKIDNDRLVVSDTLSGGSIITGNLFGDVIPANLAVSKSDTPGSVVAGTILTYTLAYTNHGPADALDVYITDTLPISVAFGQIVSENPDLPGFGQDGQQLTWYTPTLAAGTSGTIVFTVTVDRDVADGATITNSVVITSSTADTTPGNNSAEEPTLITTRAELTISKSDDPPGLSAGQILTYTLVYANNGPSDAQDVTITDTLPISVNYQGGLVSQPPGWSGPTYTVGPPPTLTWYTPTLAAGASGTIVFTVEVDSGAGDGVLITNTVEVTSTTFDPTTPNTDEEPTFVGATADLAITKSGAPASVVPGETLTYTLVYTNYGPSNSQNVYITDTLPAAADVAFGGMVNPPSFNPVESGQQLTWYTPTLTADESGTIVFTVTVKPDAVGNRNITNNVTIEGETEDVIPINDHADVSTYLPCGPDGYEVDDGMGSARAVTFPLTNTHTVTELHAFHAKLDQDWLKLAVRPGAQYVFATSNLGPLADTVLTLYAEDGTTVLRENDDAGSNVQSSWIAWTAPLTPETQTLYLAAWQTPYNAYSCNTDYTLALTQTVGGDLAALSSSQKAVDPTSVKLDVGDPVTYTIALTNTDMVATAPVTVTDTLPTTITLESAQVCGWSGQYEQYQLVTTTAALTWVGGLDANSHVSLCVQGTVAITPWNSTNTAWVWVTWNSNPIQLQVTGGEPEIGGIYLPIIVKDH